MKTLFVAWRNPEGHAWFPIGRLQFDGKHYTFVYTKGVKDASQCPGFSPLHSFPFFEKEYSSSSLFPFFSNRLISKSRPDYKDYIDWMNISQEQAEEMEIFSRNGGRKATDYFECFPCPELNENGFYSIHFFAQELGHFQGCPIERINELEVGEKLFQLYRPPSSEYWESLLLLTENYCMIGSCPQYIVDLFREIRLAVEWPERSMNVSVKVEKINFKPTPLQFRLLCKMTVKCPPNFYAFSSPEYQPMIASEVLQA